MKPWLAFLYKSKMKFLEHPSVNLCTLQTPGCAYCNIRDKWLYYLRKLNLNNKPRLNTLQQAILSALSVPSPVNNPDKQDCIWNN
jgi:hypothetical protein